MSVKNKKIPSINNSTLIVLQDPALSPYWTTPPGFWATYLIRFLDIF